MKPMLLIICLLLSFQSQGDDAYDAAFEHFVNNSYGLFVPQAGSFEWLKSMEIAEEVKQNLLNCVSQERMVFFKALIPTFQKHLTGEELISASDWLMSDEGKTWFDVLNGDVEESSLSQAEIDSINQFAGGDIMQKLAVATKEAISIAPQAGREFAQYCGEKSGFK